MKAERIIVLVLVIVLAVACSASETAVRTEREQQGAGVLAIVQNQPVPDLGGWSFEREIVRQTYIARNTTVATYSYAMTFDGRVIELCSSIGYPIPYSTQLTNPEQPSGSGYPIPNPEPNSLYPPGNALATLVQCVNPDGTVSPMYFEPEVFAVPYRLVSDIQFKRVDDQSAFSIQVQP